MFTIQEIKSAHSKVKSGADFPAYVQDLIKLGVRHYETFVNDGHTDYFGENEYRASSPARYAKLSVGEDTDAEQFKSDLKAHQEGHTNYDAFIESCAKHGIAKWIVRMDAMTCTYFDKSDNNVLVENIPS